MAGVLHSCIRGEAPNWYQSLLGCSVNCGELGAHARRPDTQRATGV